MAALRGRDTMRATLNAMGFPLRETNAAGKPVAGLRWAGRCGKVADDEESTRIVNGCRGGRLAGQGRGEDASR